MIVSTKKMTSTMKTTSRAATLGLRERAQLFWLISGLFHKDFYGCLTRASCYVTLLDELGATNYDLDVKCTELTLDLIDASFQEEV